MTGKQCQEVECQRPHYARGLCKMHYKRTARVATEPARCLICSLDFERPKAGRPKVYCSPECRRLGWTQNRPDRSIPGRVKRDGKMVYPYCLIFFPLCATCGERFTARAAHAKHCSDKCRYRASAPQTCRSCGREREAWATLCTECRRAARRIARSARRARVRQTQVEAIDPREIFARDGWRCGICRAKVTRTLAYPHPRSASLDHVLPLAKGGTHTRENVQCAHLECNLAKRDSVEGQALLFG